MKKILLLLLMALALSSCINSSKGTLCLTFDDRYFGNWINSIPVFEEYDARVTFFICGNVDAEALEAMKTLQSAGHTIGLHGVNHARTADFYNARGEGAYSEEEVLPQLRLCRENGIEIRAFAYPYSQRNPDTDRELFKIFDFLRTSSAAVKTGEMKLAEVDACFIKRVDEKQLFYGFSASGDFDMEELKAAMRRVAAEDSVLILYAHNIVEEIPPSHHIAVSQLKELLEYAGTLGISVKGVNEL